MELNKFIGTKIKKFRESRNMTQDELAELLDTTRQSISRYENGERKANQDLLFELASIFKVSLDDFFPVRNLYDQTNIIKVTPENMVAIPVIGTIACGDPILADENIIGYRYHLKDRLPKGQTFYLTAKGDSMEPKIPDGSDVLIRMQDDVEDGEIAAVLVNGDSEATLKRVKKQGDIVMLVAENTDYAPYIITEHNPARILGKAVGVSFYL
ncbi:peptidase s24/s26a/s26b [Trichococcus flocculiformis]|uniref:Peptidase s24/s26a/s26b n=1 Tax=Trichococcus flocculiformis TaxID=82803 RepID=A0AB38BH41_9LACT|nr:XRE family transcriptional regulator [Trichococcus flocculiformis]CZQ83733.1 peptidase s24/s26a/s26b [Trichococcus flocculiformis]SFH70884.1 repressor LexA [Trichococcus flocculiformis]